MWMLSFIPDWIIHFFACVSIIILVLSFLSSNIIPLAWRLPIQFLSLVLVAGSLWLEGGLSNEASWRAKVAEQQLEIARLETASQQVTVNTITKYIERTKVVKEKADVII